MRALIGGFALGVGWLQTQSALPDARLLWNAGAVAGVLIVRIAARSRPGGIALSRSYRQ